MKPFRKHLVLAIDGGGVRGGIATRALRRVEEKLNIRLPDIVNLTVGTSAGAIIAAALAVDLSATELDGLFPNFCEEVFKKRWKNAMPFKFFVNHQYSNQAFMQQLKNILADMTFEEFKQKHPTRKMVTTTFDVIHNKTRFLKTDKPQYANWPFYKAVLASAAAPTYFPVVDGQYIDGGVGSYNNPCYLAAYETQYVLNWDPGEVTLISLGAGRTLPSVRPGEADKFSALGWIPHILDGFSYSADDQQVRLVDTFFPDLDFRRYQVDLEENIALDDASAIGNIHRYGEQMADMILNDEVDRAMLHREGRKFAASQFSAANPI
ncbi:MAG: patatin-like phospholipase family protein [Anaerolineales bacterium]|jgi:predicted acylesterase/phospholipase RssA|nr:patatin-like phospholipase family protein [Anaerolineales bacterium]